MENALLKEIKRWSKCVLEFKLFQLEKSQAATQATEKSWPQGT